MSPILKSIALTVPAVRRYVDRVAHLRADRDRLARELERLTSERASAQMPALALTSAPLAAPAPPPILTDPQEGWAEPKRRKQEMSKNFRTIAASASLTPRIEPHTGRLDDSLTRWVQRQMEAEPYWFQKVEVLPGLYSPGWSDPAVDKLPYYGLPADLTGKRVLDVGCAEGFFSFEAERRGAREVIGIDSFPDSVRRFNIIRAAQQSNASAFLLNVYDLEPKRLGTFDLVLFYGVLYHLKHPQLALERIRSVCTGDLLFQTVMLEEPSVKGTPWARFYPHGMMSGSKNELFDPTVFWLFNSACCLAMLDHVGFTNLKILSTDPHPFVVSASIPDASPGSPPDQTESPWS